MDLTEREAIDLTMIEVDSPWAHHKARGVQVLGFWVREPHYGLGIFYGSLGQLFLTTKTGKVAARLAYTAPVE